MLVVGSAQDFCSIVARLREEAGDFNGGSNGDDAGVGGEAARRLLGGSSVGVRVVLSVWILVGWSLGRERRRDVGRDIGQRQSGLNGSGASVGNSMGTRVCLLVGASVGDSMGLSVRALAENGVCGK